MRKAYSPDNVGVPVRAPPDVKVTPAGSDPSICDHVINPAQQALSVLEYGDPVVVEPRSLFVLILIPPGPAPLMKKPFDTCSVLPAGSVESVNFATRLKLPLSCGVPATVSVSPSSVSPTGS